MTLADLTTEEIAARIRRQTERVAAPPEPTVEQAVNGFRYYDPLPSAAEEHISWATRPKERVYTGIDEFDVAMRGLAPREMLVVVGYAHSGKTVFTTEVIVNNPHRRIAFFTPDETRVLVLVKLACLMHGLSAEELERRIQADDGAARELLRRTATESFPNLGVFEDALTLDQMDKALDEFERHHTGPAELVIFDYLDLLYGCGEDVPSKFNAIKGWGKRRNLPLMVLHQTSRSAGSDGRAMTISSGGYGGEQQATFMVGVRRKKSQYLSAIRELQEKLPKARNPEVVEELIREAEYDLKAHENTVTFSLVKNKRPPSRLVDDTDFFLDPTTGRITNLGDIRAGSTDYQRMVRQAAQAAAPTWTEPTLDEAF